jgi:hypothetical protein
VCCDQLLAAGLRQYADGSVQMASVIRRETDFDPEAIAVLADAVDEAWYRLRGLAVNASGLPTPA